MFLCFFGLFQLDNLKMYHIWVFDDTLEVWELFDPYNFFSQFTAFFTFNNYKKIIKFVKKILIFFKLILEGILIIHVKNLIKTQDIFKISLQ